MESEQLDKLGRQIKWRVWAGALAAQLVVGFMFWLLSTHQQISWPILATAFVAISCLASYLVGGLADIVSHIPLAALGNAIMHVSPSKTAAPAQIETLRIGREYVTSLVYQLYQMASLQDNKVLAEHKREATQASNILIHLPLPVFVCNESRQVTFATDAATTYCRIDHSSLQGQPLVELVDLEFSDSFTLESWMEDCQKNKATDAAYWRRVRLLSKDENTPARQFDMTGYYNRDNPSGVVYILTLQDRTENYEADDQGLGFMALAVHELRMPLTIMRGYIEVFEEELEGKLDEEMTISMHRMQAASRQLSGFVHNILNVARIEENQLVVKMGENTWTEMVQRAATDIQIGANVAGITINYDIPANLPAVAVDPTTIYEVLCNLLDNAIKYSGDQKKIDVRASLTKDGLIETIVQDYGVGIPTSVIPRLFEKFHRNHRNRNEIAGSGLGLYLSKVIVNAHGGDIWVKSKESEGTSVGFTVQPYTMVADEQKNGDNKDDMVRTAHGWIKNHSLYRR